MIFADSLTWPEAAVFIVIALAVAWIAVAVIKDNTKWTD